jgi:hypothetical protein
MIEGSEAGKSGKPAICPRVGTYGAIGRAPHLPQLELFDARLVRRDGRALDADVVLEDRLGRLDRHPVIGLRGVAATQKRQKKSHRSNVNWVRGKGRAEANETDRIAMLETQIVVLDVKLHVREDELSRTPQRRNAVNCNGRGVRKPKRSAFSTSSREKGGRPRRTCSRMFLHIIRVISSPSSSTTGFFTTIFSPENA